MRVKYVKIDNAENVRYKINWQIPYERFPLIIGQEYTVYAIEYTSEGTINFFIMDEGGSIYPHNYPSEFFIVTDRRMSQQWVGFNGTEKYRIDHPAFPNLITFNDWKNNKFFEEEMMDNIGNANAVFKKYKHLIDNEFPDNQLQKSISVGDNWVMCIKCDDSWEILNNSGIIECPKCYTKQNNPYYI